MDIGAYFRKRGVKLVGPWLGCRVETDKVRRWTDNESVCFLVANEVYKKTKRADRDSAADSMARHVDYAWHRAEALCPPAALF